MRKKARAKSIKRGTPGLDRRDFIKSVGAAALITGAPSIITSCKSSKKSSTSGAKTLNLLQWNHFVPQYDAWFDAWATEWGNENNVTVTVDHVPQGPVEQQIAAELNAQDGPHDLFELRVVPSAFEGLTLDLADVHQEAESRYGAQLDLCKQGTYNPRTGTYNSYCHAWSGGPLNYRKSLWSDSAVGLPNGPSTYDELLSGCTEIFNKFGVSAGFGVADNDDDSNKTVRMMLWAHGASVQDVNGNITLDSAETRAAITFMQQLYNQAVDKSVDPSTGVPHVNIGGWTSAGNNQGLVGGTLSIIANPVSAYRTAQSSNPTTANDIYFAPPVNKLDGTIGLGMPNPYFNYAMAPWSPNIDTAKEFLLAFSAQASDAMYNSQLYNLPAFPQTVPNQNTWLSNDPFGSTPADKLSLFSNASTWSVNLGWPGPVSAFVGAVQDQFILTKMFRDAVLGGKTVDQAVADAMVRVNAAHQQFSY